MPENYFEKHRKVSNIEEARRAREERYNPQKPMPRSHLKSKAQKKSDDFTLLFVIILLLLFGLVMVFSSSYYLALTSSRFNNDMYYFVNRQLMWSVLGIAGMFVMMHVNYRILKNFTLIGYLAILGCLILVLFVGNEYNGGRRWLGIPNSTIGFQPSEIAKFVIIVCLAHYISRNKNCLSTFKEFCKCSLIWAVPTALIAVENLSTAIVVAGISVCMMFVASPVIWYFVALAGAGVAGIVTMVAMPQFAYRIDRITYWLDPFSDPTHKGFQIIQGLYAVASGGLFGLGLGQSRQKTYLPEPYNDMIFAIICEELGMVGAFIILLLFGVFIWRGAKIAMNAQDVFGCLIAAGMTALIGIQVIINVAVATNSMPNTGMQLPFISYGGSGLFFTLVGMGILLNVSKFQKNTNK